MRSRVDEAGNSILDCGDVRISGFFRGSGNTVKIDPSPHGLVEKSGVIIQVFGSGNLVRIGAGAIMRDLSIVIGSEGSPADSVMVYIGENFSCEPGCSFLLYNSGNHLEIGCKCMFSRNITVRCGELPHMIFDTETGAYLDGPNVVKIGNHVWVGENAYLTKHSSVADGCVVGACAVVTRHFSQAGCVIAGNPAAIVRRNIKWFRNRSFLPEGSVFEKSWLEHAQSIGNS